MFAELLFACHATNTLWANVAKRVRTRRPLRTPGLPSPASRWRHWHWKSPAASLVLSHQRELPSWAITAATPAPPTWTRHSWAGPAGAPAGSRCSIRGPGAPSGRLGVLTPATPGGLLTTSWGAAFHLLENRPHLELPLSPHPCPRGPLWGGAPRPPTTGLPAIADAG